MAALSVAVVAVRAFAVGRGRRPLRRAAGHPRRDPAGARPTCGSRVYRRLERLAPSGLPAFRSGDLLTRLVADVDGVQDVFLRALLPLAVRPGRGPRAAAVVASLLPARPGPWCSPRRARWSRSRALGDRPAGPRRRPRPPCAARGELADRQSSTPSTGCPSSSPTTPSAARLAGCTDVDRRLRGSCDRAARAAGAGAAALALSSASPCGASSSSASPAVAAGAAGRRAPWSWSPCCRWRWPRSSARCPPRRRSSPGHRRRPRRVLEVLDAPGPGAPSRPRPRLAARPPYRLRVEGLAVRWTPTGPDVVTGARPRPAARPPGRARRAERVAARPRVATACCGSSTRRPAGSRWAGSTPRDLDGDDVRARGRAARPGRPRVRLDGAGEPAARAAGRDTEDELRDALRRARLLDWVDALPDGLDTWVGEHGARLSGGERQRLALARVLLADSAGALLDEPTEHLDAATADALTARPARRHPRPDRAAGDPPAAGLEAFDEVVVLDHGRVVERGTHDELVAAAAATPLRSTERAANALLG